MNGYQESRRRDPLREARILKHIVQVGVYLAIPGYLVPFRLLLDMSLPQLLGSLFSGLIIATVAIEGAFWQMYRLRKQSAYPHLIALELSTVHDLRQAYESALRLTSHYLKAQAAVLAWVDESGQPAPVAALGLPAGWQDRLGPSPDHEPIRDVLESQRVVLGRTSQCLCWSGLFRDDRTVAYVPLVSAERVTAVLILVGPRRSSDLRDRKLLEAIGVVIGLSLENIRLNHSEYESIMEVLCQALDMRDSGTQGHSQRVAHLAGLVARQMGLPSAELKRVEQAAALHDIGKIGVADAILSKPGPLTDDEWAEMRRHPALGFQILANVQGLQEVAEIVHSHHERYDGQGYPRGPRGEAIHLGARIFAVVDTYDAITSHRPYRRARSHNEALQEIVHNSGSQFDPAVVRAFQELARQGLVRPHDHPDGHSAQAGAAETVAVRRSN